MQSTDVQQPSLVLGHVEEAVEFASHDRIKAKSEGRFVSFRRDADFHSVAENEAPFSGAFVPGAV